MEYVYAGRTDNKFIYFAEGEKKYYWVMYEKIRPHHVVTFRETSVLIVGGGKYIVPLLREVDDFYDVMPQIPSRFMSEVVLM